MCYSAAHAAFSSLLHSQPRLRCIFNMSRGFSSVLSLSLTSTDRAAAEHPDLERERHGCY